MSRDLQAETRPPNPSGPAAGTAFAALVSYAVLLFAFWMAAREFRIAATINHFASAFAAFALLLAPYWFFGFGLAGVLRRGLRSRAARLLLPGSLVTPYLLFSLPRGGFQSAYAVIFFVVPIALAALYEFAPTSGGLAWQDLIVLMGVGIPVEFSMLRGAWRNAGLGAVPKLLLMDALLYAFLVVRGVPDAGYDFRPRWRDLAVGVREWAFFAPLAIALGLALRFIRFRPFVPYASSVASGWLVTFFFVAIPEELFFRGLLQNLLEQRFARTSVDAHSARVARMKALLVAAPVFGLSHFNKPLPFNWRYVLLATLAGIFYGRAWRDRRRLFCSGVTHATVDVVWSVWFR